MSRPSKLTPEVVAKLCEAIELGATYELACGYAGIGYSTFNRWRKQAESAKSGVVWQFWQDIKASEGKAAVEWLNKIEAASDSNWQAAAWKLERRFPQSYGRTVQDVNHNTGDGDPLGESIVKAIDKIYGKDA